jgi:competence protein ComEC
MEPLEGECRVTVLDVGQDQCILLQSEGKNFMVDCGGSDDQNAADEAASLLLSQGISRLDGLIITHFDRDHAGGAMYLLTRVEADCLYLPNCADDDGLGEGLRAYSSAVFTVEADTIVTFGNTKITLIPSKSRLSNNESGLCVLYQTEKCDILITGDRSAAGERELIEAMTLPELEVLIVGHHGSKHSTCRELLIKTSPEYAIISVGENSYGHPTQEVLQRLRDFGCQILRTDQNGTIIIRR